MELHRALSDKKLKNTISNCTLNPELFTHEAHLRLAWIHIKEQGLEHALCSITDDLKRYVKHIGVPEKYHVTLTVAGIYAVNHFAQSSKSLSFKEFITDHPQLKSHFKELISSHYGFDIFTSHQARSEFIEPDLLPFE